MKTINKNNYESFFLDYLEGRLNTEQTEVLMRFLDENPALREELEGFEMVTVEPDSSIRFEGSKSLKKPVVMASGNINEHNFEEIFAAYAEGDLSQPEMEQVHTFVGLNPHLGRELELLVRCRLQADEKIIFPDKASLKKPVIFPILTRRLYYGIAAAASLALLIGLSFLFKPEPINKDIIVNIEPVIVEEPITPGSQLAETPAGEKPGQATPGRIVTPVSNYDADASGPSATSVQQRNLSTIGLLASVSIPPEILRAEPPKPVMSEQRYFSGYYADISLAQNIRHAELLEDEPSPERLLAQGTAVVREIMQPGEEDIRLLPDQIDLWKIADAGINGFARLTGADIEFRKTTDNQGRVTSFAFESQSMVINRNLRKSK